jgi:Transposase DDE domain group 1
VIAKVEWHPGELYPRVGFIVTNMSRPAERIVAFYNKRGTCEQWIKEGKGAIKWTRLSCRSFAANAVRLQLHALAYNLHNFLRTLATPEPSILQNWSLLHRSGGVADDTYRRQPHLSRCPLSDRRSRRLAYRGSLGVGFLGADAMALWWISSQTNGFGLTTR